MMDLDDFDWKTDALLSSENSRSTSYWTFTLGDDHIKIDLDVVITGSLFLRHKLLQKAAHEEPDDLNQSSSGDGDVNVISLKGTVVKAGCINKTVLDLKQHICAYHGISVERQRLFVSIDFEKDDSCKGIKQLELDEDWRTLQSYNINRGDTLQISLREPWQRTEGEAKRTVLNLPEPCQSAFETFMKLLYDLHYRPTTLTLPESDSMEEILALYWMAARFQVRPLGAQIIDRLEKGLTKANAHVCLSAAVKLGLGSKLTEAAAQLAGQALEEFPLEAINKLSIPVFEVVILASQVAGKSAARSRNKCIASYLRHYAPKLVQESYCRLSKLMVCGVDDDALLHTIDAEYVLFLLGLAIKYQDEQSQHVWTDIAAQCFADLSYADLSSIPLDNVVALLSSPALAIESEDLVYEAVKEYVTLQGAMLSQQQMERVWRCCRFAHCSPRVQTELVLRPETDSLAKEYLAGVVAASVQASAHVESSALHERFKFCTSAQTLPRQPVKRRGASAGVVNLSAGAILGADALKEPFYAAIDAEGHILVTDDSLHEVLVFTTDSSVARRFGSKGTARGQFNGPRGIAVDRQGRIVVADYSNNRIQVLNADGSVACCFGSEGSAVGQLKHPVGVAIDREGHIVVADCWNDRIQVFKADGTVVRHFGSKGAAVGQLSGPLGVAVDGAGRIVVAEWGNHRVQVFNGDGSVALCLGSQGSEPGQLKNPWGVAVDRQGRFVVADTNNHRVQVWNADGSVARVIGAEGDGVGQLMYPMGVAVDRAGRILVAEGVISCRGRFLGNHRLQVF